MKTVMLKNNLLAPLRPSVLFWARLQFSRSSSGSVI